MSHQAIFETWKRYKEQMAIDPGFSGQVMARVRERRAVHEAPESALISLLRHWAARPSARAAMIVIGVFAGLVRILMTLQFILFT
jgi:hypothetical protein